MFSLHTEAKCIGRSRTRKAALSQAVEHVLEDGGKVWIFGRESFVVEEAGRFILLFRRESTIKGDD